MRLVPSRALLAGGGFLLDAVHLAAYLFVHGKDCEIGIGAAEWNVADLFQRLVQLQQLPAFQRQAVFVGLVDEPIGYSR